MAKIIIECEDKNIDWITSLLAMHKLANSATVIKGEEELEVVLPEKRRLPAREPNFYQRASKVINNHIIKN